MATCTRNSFSSCMQRWMKFWTECVLMCGDSNDSDTKRHDAWWGCGPGFAGDRHLILACHYHDHNTSHYNKQPKYSHSCADCHCRQPSFRTGFYNCEIAGRSCTWRKLVFAIAQIYTHLMYVHVHTSTCFSINCLRVGLFKAHAKHALMRKFKHLASPATFENNLLQYVCKWCT